MRPHQLFAKDVLVAANVLRSCERFVHVREFTRQIVIDTYALSICKGVEEGGQTLEIVGLTYRCCS